MRWRIQTCVRGSKRIRFSFAGPGRNSQRFRRIEFGGIAKRMEHTRISVDPDVMGGRACIAGTRVPVHIILGHLGSGANLAELLEGYPMISQADVQAAITYAADLVEHEGVIAA